MRTLNCFASLNPDGLNPLMNTTGAGASFWYKFWRFPLPLGLSCTYSFDDQDSQVSAALGGRF